MPTSDELKEKGKAVFSETLRALGDEWKSLTDEEKGWIKEAGEDAVKIGYAHARGDDVKAEKAYVDHNLARIKSIAADTVANSLWAAVEKAVGLVAGALRR